MIFKRNGPNIFGVDFNAKEQKAINKELQKQIEEYIRELHKRVDAIFLWEMHKQLGHGKKRLKRFYKGFRPAVDGLVAQYELDDNLQDKVWITKKQLQDIGVDIDEWEKENT